MTYKLQYKPYGSQAILIEWPEDIKDVILKDILNFKIKIEYEIANKIEDLISGYNSLTIKYSIETVSFLEEIKKLKEIYSKPDFVDQTQSNIWQNVS